jgi:hypothetical protein
MTLNIMIFNKFESCFMGLNITADSIMGLSIMT